MSSFNPLVSIIIPVYNGSNYLREAIDSALAQTYKNIEVLVINDGSNDNGKTEKIAKSYKDKIRYFKKSNGGVASALNLGLKEMKGEYFSWLSHDDMYCPDKIEKQIKLISEQNNKKVVLFTDYEYIDKNNRTIETIIIKDRLISTDIRLVFLRKLIDGLTLLLPREIMIESGGFNERLSYTQDYDMWLRIMQKTEFIYMNFVSSKTRLHQRQDSRVSKSQIEADRFWLCVARHLDFFEPLFDNHLDLLLEFYKMLFFSDHIKTKQYIQQEIIGLGGFDKLFDDWQAQKPYPRSFTKKIKEHIIKMVKW